MKCLITCLLIFINLLTFAFKREMNLQRALDLKLVNAQVKSLGGYRGRCIQMTLKNLGQDSLIIFVEAGRRLNSVNDKQQDILITAQQTIVLRKLESKSFAVEGFCCQASNHSPIKDAAYTINKMADSSLVKLACFLNENKTDPHLAQQAIWSISDNKPVSCISSIWDTVPSDIKTLVCVLKGAKMPWYSLITKTFVYSNGAMQTSPVWLRGQLIFDNDKKCYTTMHVVDENGFEVCHIIQQWSYPGAAQAYSLNIPLRGLPKGKYKVELISNEKQLAVREFEI
jgi:hypothetical protein